MYDDLRPQYDSITKASFLMFHSSRPDNKKSNKSADDVKKDIAGVIRQITATVTFLPLLDCSCKSSPKTPFHVTSRFPWQDKDN